MGKRFSCPRCGDAIDVRQKALPSPILLETTTDVKKPPTVFIIDNRPAVVSLLEAAVKEHHLPVECYSSAAQFLADSDVNLLGCILLDPLVAGDADLVLRWLHDPSRLLSIVLISGLIQSSSPGLAKSPSVPVALKPHEHFALMTMVTDGVAGSITRQVIRGSYEGPRKG